MDERTAWGRTSKARATSGFGSPADGATTEERARVARRRRPLPVVVGGAILAAIGLLWPFADWDWRPIAIGFGVLVLLYLLRLNRLLLGWAPHLAGLVTVALLLGRTGPWVWGFAAGLAVLGYGLVRLPDWRVAAAGLVLTALFGAGYGISQYRTDAQVAAEAARTRADQSAAVRANAAELLVPSVTNSLASGDVRTLCALLGPAAGAQFAAAHAAPDCPSAATALASRVSDPGAYRSATLPQGSIVKRPDGATVDACRARWPGGVAPGPTLGRFELRRYPGRADSFLVAGYEPCRG